MHEVVLPPPFHTPRISKLEGIEVDAVLVVASSCTCWQGCCCGGRLVASWPLTLLEAATWPRARLGLLENDAACSTLVGRAAISKWTDGPNALGHKLDARPGGKADII